MEKLPLHEKPALKPEAMLFTLWKGQGLEIKNKAQPIILWQVFQGNNDKLCFLYSLLCVRKTAMSRKTIICQFCSSLLSFSLNTKFVSTGMIFKDKKWREI